MVAGSSGDQGMEEEAQSGMAGHQWRFDLIKEIGGFPEGGNSDLKHEPKWPGHLQRPCGRTEECKYEGLKDP